MKPTQIDDCIPFQGRDFRYQAEAAQAYYVEHSMVPATWEWIVTTCGTALCLNTDHMRFNQPHRLAYLPDQCIYCGRSGYTKDHLLPRAYSGEAKRAFVVTVPACGTCNDAISDTLTWSITERRAICHARLRRKYRRVLNHVEYGPTDLREFGPTLRKSVVKGMADKREVMAMLAWPGDPAYDLRACEQAGIEDPYAIGLLISEHEANRIAAEVTAPPQRETVESIRDAAKAAKAAADRKTRERKRRMDAKVAALELSACVDAVARAVEKLAEAEAARDE